MGGNAVYFSGDDVFDVFAELFYRFDLGAGARHQLGVIAVGHIKFYIVFQPVE